MHRVFIRKLGEGYLDAVRAGFEHLGLGRRIRPGDAVFIKPNLTFPVYRQGVMTSPACVEALVVALKDYTDRIVVGEADSGGYNRFSMDAVLEKTGISALQRTHGIRVVNLSRTPSREIACVRRGREIRFPVPALITDESALVISAAVPKIHMNTLVSMTVKNLWGCIPEPPIRLRLHPSLDAVLHAIVRSLPQSIGVIDGRYGLNRSGPLRGDPVRLDWLAMAGDLYAADVAGCHLIGVDPRRVYYLRDAQTRGYRMPGLSDLEFSEDWHPLRAAPAFHLRRAWTDYPGALAFRSPLLAYIAYRSPLSRALHRLLYVFREPFYDYDDPGQTAR